MHLAAMDSDTQYTNKAGIEIYRLVYLYDGLDKIDVCVFITYIIIKIAIQY